MTSHDKHPSTNPAPIPSASPPNTSQSIVNGKPIAPEAMAVEPPDLDDFGLPITRYVPSDQVPQSESSSSSSAHKHVPPKTIVSAISSPDKPSSTKGAVDNAAAKLQPPKDEEELPQTLEDGENKITNPKPKEPPHSGKGEDQNDGTHEAHKGSNPLPSTDKVEGTVGEGDMAKDVSKRDSVLPAHATHSHGESLTSAPGISEFSHQQITKPKEKEGGGGEDWQEMPAYAAYDLYDDDDRLIAKEHHEEEDESYGYAGLGGAGKGYTRLQLDDDAESATSMDENTQYLFKNAGGTSIIEDYDQQRDAVSQLQATKDLLTEGQRIAYVGLTRLELSTMVKETETLDPTNKKKPKKEVQIAAESMKMWAQKMMIRLYSHMDVSPAEQVMIEQLSEHGVIPADMTGALMQNSTVNNPMREDAESKESPKDESGDAAPSVMQDEQDPPTEPPPAYEAHAHDGGDMLEVKTPSELPTTQKLEIDLRWTVLCDLFLVLIADSIYDARSRTLLEKLGKDLEISWLDICRFEKRVTDALEMQQAAEKENWNEEGHMETRRKLALKRRYVMMGLATVGGGLVIGLSAGLMAPLIGGGLAAGFATIGVAGTQGFLGGTAAAAIITSGAAASGSYIGGKAADRRTGAVKTFEYRPLHNNKRANLIITVSGWMTGKVDDVRLPFSTVDPVMGDIYSILWEPDMLTSMGDTINILATEALTQGLQQILGSTILMGLMAALQAPVILTKLSYLIDNPWVVSLDRATSAGLILADSLIERNLGTRPVTLVGYSLGSRVIFSCLKELAKKGAYGLVQNVYMFGSPVVVNSDDYLKARSVVGGRFVNGYNRNDWILGYLFRITNGGIRRVAGLVSVDEVRGIENIDVTEYVAGHMDYRRAMPRLLREACGWLVESDEFTEIEDADPENHQERQRELINEIEEARKELEREGAGKKKSVFSVFARKKKLKRADWEVYEDANKSKSVRDAAAAAKRGGGANSKGGMDDAEGDNQGVLFDVDAIRAELAHELARARLENEGGGKIREYKQDDEEEMFQVKEIKSTLPPMKLNITPSAASTPGGRSFTPSPSSESNHRDHHQNHQHRPSMHDSSFRETKSTSNIPYRTASFESRRSASPLPPAKSPAHKYGGGGGFGQDDWEEDEISMTFDTSFREPSPPPPLPAKDTTSERYGAAPSVTVTAAEDGGLGGGWGGEGAYRPNDNIASAATNSSDDSRGYGASSSGGGGGGVLGGNTNMAKKVPVIPAKNPWADNDEFDDPDFGKEKDIEITFA